MKNTFFIILIFIVSCKKQDTNSIKNNNLVLIDSLLITKTNPANVKSNNKNIYEKLKKLKNKIRLQDSLLSFDKAKKDSIRPLYWNSCKEYYKIIKESKAIEAPIIDSIKKSLITKSVGLTINQAFVNDILNFKQNNSTKYLTDYPLYPIFNINNNPVGGYLVKQHLQERAETKLIQNTSYNESLKKNYNNTIGKLVLYNDILDNIDTKTYHFSTTKSYKTNFNRFGKYQNECDLQYFFYESNINVKDDYLLGSKYNLELEFISNKKLDAFLYISNPSICQDCPTSYQHQKSFAKLKSFDNLYFTYTKELDSKIDKTDTPIRSLIYYKDGFSFALWSTSIDLFGCSCL